MKNIATLFCCLFLSVSAMAQQNWKAVMRYDKQLAKEQLTKRFMEYVTYDTQSSSHSQTTPSTKGQLALAKALAKELKRIGASNVQTTKTGFVIAEIPATTAKPTPTLVFLAHLDTSEALSGQNVKPQLHAKYKGGDIIINKEKNLCLTEYNSPQLLQARGHDIITAYGETLLGADDKAGIAIIMTFADYLLGNLNIEHGPIKIVFSPDEEIRTGIKALDIDALQADYAYTVDGGGLGEIVVENFNSRRFNAVFNGMRSVHGEYAMNADFSDNVLMASDFHTLLPRHRRPENTSGTRGYIYVHSITTEDDRSVVSGNIRAFTDEEMQELSQIVTQAFNTTKSLNPKNKGAELTFQDEYKNAKAVIPAEVIEMAENAMRQEEIQPKRISVRGGTDGGILSFKNLPTADLFAGMFNTHSALEYADVDVMEASLRTLMSTACGWVGQKTE